MKIVFIFLAFFCFNSGAFAQNTTEYKWWNPAEDTISVLEGQGWSRELQSFYDRLPARAEKLVRTDVWSLSKHSAGLYLKFNSNSSEITVRYTTGNKDNYAMPHMPATGVSGLDLYAITQGGRWVWAPGKYKFGDTIEYRFTNIEVDPDFKGRDCEFRLFLPLYNSVHWMQIGVPADKKFLPLPLTRDKPIVVYGTSIAQGGCASRPGLAWPSILERKLDRPLLNLAFSGNGRLEKPLIDLLNEIDARLYVLDCLPNMVVSAGFSEEELERRITESVLSLRKQHPAVPILLVDHSLSAQTGIIETVRNTECENANRISGNVFEKLKSQGLTDLYRLGSAEIGLDLESTVDGVHPNDIGMEKYAMAYTKAIQKILKEPESILSTTIPVMQTRDGYDWRGRDQTIKDLTRKKAPNTVIIANSIIHYWGGEPAAATVNGAGSWKKYMVPLGVQNMGFGWDRIENALWRVYHGALDGYDTKHIVLMIGTNNLELNTDPEIIAGLKQLIEAIRIRQPKAQILLSGIFPRRALEKRVLSINLAYSRLAAGLKISYINPGKSLLLNSSPLIDESLFSDGLHPNARGYDKLAPEIVKYLK